METKYGRAKEYSRGFWSALRTNLLVVKNEVGTWPKFAEVLGTSPDAYRKFVDGHANALTEGSLDVLRKAGEKFFPPELQFLATEEKAKPKQVAWAGETISVKAAAEAKGVNQSTIRRWLLAGRLNRQEGNGRKVRICLDEAYKAIAPTAKARLVEAEAKVAALEAQIQTMQLTFNFEALQASEKLREEAVKEYVNVVNDANGILLKAEHKINMGTSENLVLRKELFASEKTNEFLRNQNEALKNEVYRLREKYEPKPTKPMLPVAPQQMPLLLTCSQ